MPGTGRSVEQRVGVGLEDERLRQDRVTIGRPQGDIQRARFGCALGGEREIVAIATRS